MKRFDANIPLFLQVKEEIEDLILKRSVTEGEQIPSVRSLGKEYGLNPNTINVSISELVRDEVLYKQRGIGMFVQEGAREKVKSKRLERFKEEEITRLLGQAKILEIEKEELIRLINEKYHRGNDEAQV